MAEHIEESDLDDDSEEQLFELHQFTVDPGQSALRIDKFLNDKLEKLSRNKIQTAAKAGLIRVDGETVKPNFKVKPGQDIRLYLPEEPRQLQLIPENIPLNIVYEDDTVVVLNKPAGLVVHPGHGNYRGTLVNALLYHFDELSNATHNTEPRPGLVHRLDKDTSGVMVVAKNDEAHAHLAGQFFQRTTERRYVALVWGDLEEEAGTITGHIGRSLKDRKVMQVFPDGEFGKHAITHWKVLERFGYVTLVQCKLETGRTHQIRAHFKHIGHPLFSDERYGGDRILKGTTFTKYKQFIQNCFSAMPRQALHAKSLGFEHPESGERMQFESELPEDFAEVLERWRNYIATRKE